MLMAVFILTSESKMSSLFFNVLKAFTTKYEWTRLICLEICLEISHYTQVFFIRSCLEHVQEQEFWTFRFHQNQETFMIQSRIWNMLLIVDFDL